MENKSIVQEKSFEFSVRIVNLYKFLKEQKSERVMSKQLLRSGTSIGANIVEATASYSDSDFSAKLSIARKEAAETIYWLKLLARTGYITETQLASILPETESLLKMLSSIVLTMRKKLNKLEHN